jgi:hypothetical protein
MSGAISLSGWISKWSEKQRDRVKQYLDGYRTYRHLLMKDFHPLLPYPRTPEDWDSAQFLDPESREAVILTYRFAGNQARCRIFPRRLNAGATYEICDPFAPGKGLRTRGDRLMANGLEIALDPSSAAVRHLIPVRR